MFYHHKQLSGDIQAGGTGLCSVRHRNWASDVQPRLGGRHQGGLFRKCTFGEEALGRGGMGQRGERFLSNPVLLRPKARAVWTLQAGWTVEPVLCRKRVQGLSWWLSGKDSACRCQETRFTPWSRKIPRAAEQPSPCATLLRLWPRVWEPRLLSPLAAS